MKKSKHLIIGLAIAGVAIYFTLRNVSIQELVDSFKSVRYIHLLTATLLVAGTYIVRGYRWEVLLSPLKQIPLKEIYSPLMIGFMGNFLPARAGEILRAYLIANKQKIPITGTFATIVVERLFDMVMVISLFAMILVFYSDDLFQEGMTISGIPVQQLMFKFGIMSLVLLGLLIGFIYMLSFHKERLRPIIHWFTRPFPKKWRSKTDHLIDTFQQGLLAVKDKTSLIKITLLSLLTWILIVGSYYPFYWAYDLENKSMESLLIMVVLVCIFITVLPTPAYLGSFQAAILISLHEIMNVPEVTAVSLGMVAWVVNMGVVFVLGVYFLFHDHLSIGKLVAMEEEGEKVLDEKE